MERNEECVNMYLHFAIKSPSSSEKKFLIMDVFMIIASAWSLNITVEKESMLAFA